VARRHDDGVRDGEPLRRREAADPEFERVMIPLVPVLGLSDNRLRGWI
jgi:hypothetical protein